MTPSEQTLPQRLTMEIIRHLQEVDAPQVFTPRAAYDGRKNLFSIRELPFNEGTQIVRQQCCPNLALGSYCIHISAV